VNELPPSPEDSDEVDALYRRASARDASRPSESVRRAVLDHAAQLAENRAAGKDSARTATGLRTKRQSWWRPAAFGTLAAAALAGFLVIPQYLSPDAPINPTSLPAAPVPRTADRKAAPAAGDALQNVVVTGARRMPTAGRNRQSVQDASREPSAAGAPAYSTPSAAASFTGRLRLMDPAAQLRQAAELGNVPALQALLGKRPAIDARDAGGRTALMLATLHGRTEAVEALLTAGADPNAADAHGTTPLQAALAGDQPAIADALRRAGAR
jgi:hypothetical protein